MLLAAGLGTRLRPLTDQTPKALIEVGGEPILDRIVRRLIAAGADRLIINVHHLGEMIERHVRERDGWGVEVRFSREPAQALETGGGLLHARDHFRGTEPFFLHNADILTDADLEGLYAQHLRSDAVATLAVMRRDTSRYLLFDEIGLCGRVDEGKNVRLTVRDPVGAVQNLAFAGIHVISPEIFAQIEERGAFSILESYLRLAGAGWTTLPFRVDGGAWFDIGKPEQLERARAASL
jgi:N-acetyl-alpha-D-muramate 1-phosphate uridylyltransferase